VDQIKVKILSSFLLFLSLTTLKILFKVDLKSKFAKLEMPFKYVPAKDGLSTLRVPNERISAINIYARYSTNKKFMNLSLDYFMRYSVKFSRKTRI